MTKIDNEILLDFRDVLIRPKRSTLSSRSEVSLMRQFTFKHSGRSFEGFPVIGANMDGVGTFSMAREFSRHSMTVALRKGYNTDQYLDFFHEGTYIQPLEDSQHAEPEDRKKGIPNRAHWYTTGITDSDLMRLKFIMEDERNGQRGLTRLCVDVANGYTEKFVSTIKHLREKYPSTTIMAGNVVTGDMTEALILAGADIVKVGIGPGSVCTTRKMTGVGYPQLSAILECADAAHGLGGLICADGGCQVAGDIAKAFGAGADFVMLGGMLAGHEEGEYQIEYESADGGPVRFDEPVVGYCSFYGMSSDVAQLKHEGEVRKYRTSEGKVVRLRLEGPVADTISEIKGGIRSMMTYIGAKSLKEVSKRTTFVRVSQQLNPMFNDVQA